jgi:hypothetical protein
MEHKLAAAVAKFLSKKAEEIAKKLGETLGLAKADPSADDYSRRVDDAFDEIDWDWTPLAKIVEPTLIGIAVVAGKDAASNLGLFDKTTLAKMTAGATDYAKDRAAEMVGRKLVGLVDPVGNTRHDPLRSRASYGRRCIQSGAREHDPGEQRLFESPCHHHRTDRDGDG